MDQILYEYFPTTFNSISFESGSRIVDTFYQHLIVFFYKMSIRFIFSDLT